MRVLAVDSGSSSLKVTVYDMPSESVAFSRSQKAGPREQGGALKALLEQLRADGIAVDAAGHRIVFGGVHHVEPERVTPSLLQELEGLVSFDPLHLRAELGAVRCVSHAMPGLTQVLCYDTAFHRRMPAVAKRYPLPPMFGEGVQRFGYHGLSYEYVVSQTGGAGRTIVAHLGSGASLAAVRDGVPVDTTMGFSPLGGLMMATRPGDVDPGVVLYALTTLGLSPERLRILLNDRSGLLGLSGSSGDMDVLLERAAHDARAASAIELYVYTARKFIGAMTAALGGLDQLIFTGGIGENAAAIRAGICAGLSYLGVRVDPARNARHERTISPPHAAVAVGVVKTDEALTIARHVAALLTTAV